MIVTQSDGDLNTNTECIARLVTSACESRHWTETVVTWSTAAEQHGQPWPCQLHTTRDHDPTQPFRLQS